METVALYLFVALPWSLGVTCMITYLKGRLGIYNVDVADDSIIKAWNEATETYMNPPF